MVTVNDRCHYKHRAMLYTCPHCPQVNQSPSHYYIVEHVNGSTIFKYMDGLEHACIHVCVWLSVGMHVHVCVCTCECIECMYVCGHEGACVYAHVHEHAL